MKGELYPAKTRLWGGLAYGRNPPKNGEVYFMVLPLPEGGGVEA